MNQKEKNLDKPKTSFVGSVARFLWATIKKDFVAFIALLVALVTAWSQFYVDQSIDAHVSVVGVPEEADSGVGDRSRQTLSARGPYLRMRLRR